MCAFHSAAVCWHRTSCRQVELQGSRPSTVLQNLNKVEELEYIMSRAHADIENDTEQERRLQLVPISARCTVSQLNILPPMERQEAALVDFFSTMGDVIWIRAITMALREKNKLGFVDGTVAKPKTEKELRQWERCNDLVSSWILNSVSSDIQSSILYANIAHDIWIDLHERYSQSNAPKIFQLKDTIMLLKQEGMSVSEYYTKLKSLWGELSSLVVIPPCTCGHGHATTDLVSQDRGMKFLQGLHDRYIPLRSQILLMDTFPPTTKLYSLVRQEEKHQELHSLSSPMVQSAALNVPKSEMPNKNANTYNRFGGTSRQNFSSKSLKGCSYCDHCGNHGRTKATCYKIYRVPCCDQCGKEGHTKETCYKIHGFPPKKIESTSLVASTPSTSESAGFKMTSPPFSQEQYNKLLALLSSGSIHLSAGLAGPVNEEEDWTR